MTTPATSRSRTRGSRASAGRTPLFLDVLRPKPFRGDVVAAGVVVLVTLVWVVEVRVEDTWSDGLRLAASAAVWALVTAVAVLAPMERETPRAYQSVLYLASFAIAIWVLADLAAVLGGRPTTPGTAAWYFAALAALALFFAVARKSASATLLGALSAGVALLALAESLFDARVAAIRWLLLALMVVYGLTAVAQRDRRFRHGVALVDATGVAGVAIGLSFAGARWWIHLVPPWPPFGQHAGWGWQLLLLAVGFGLIAYSSVDREAGPAYLGVLNLLAFLALAREGGLLGWPLLLLAIAAALLVVGLRPTTPAPPPPDVNDPPAPPLPLR
jgi:hypothetical protein